MRVAWCCARFRRFSWLSDEFRLVRATSVRHTLAVKASVMPMEREMQKQIYRMENEGGKWTIDVELKDNGVLQVFSYDVGSAAKAAYGDSDVEHWIDVDANDVALLAFHLLADRFAGVSDAVSQLQEYCEARGIKASVGLWT